MLRILALTTCIGLLAACASTGTDQAPQADANDAQSPTIAETPPVPERQIPDDSLYPLLLAEFAIRRGAYDVALEQYTEQSPLLRDAGVAAHTANLGQFMQRNDEALEAARLWAELSPDDVEANSTLATLLVRQGYTSEALPYLAKLERSGTHTRFPALLNSFRELSDAEREELIQGIDTLAEEFPDNTELLLTQALIHTELGDYDTALDKLDHLLDLEPDQQTALVLEAEILLKTDSRRPFARIDRTLKDIPDETTLRLKYARLLIGVDLDAARKQFEILAADAPQDADYIFSLGLISREMQDYPAAIGYMNQAIALGKRTNEANYYLGRLAEDRGVPLEAIPYYLAVEESRELMQANHRIGTILIENDQLDDSHALFDEQRDRFPPQREALFGLEADLLAKAKHMDRATEVLEQGLLELPQSSSLLYARAMLLEQQGELAAMEQQLRSIIAADPDNATALNALGYTLANRTDRYAEARDLISRALLLEPNEPAILDSMGWVLYRTGHYDEAIDYLSRAHASFPDPEVAAHLGEVLWASGRQDEALDVWLEAYLKDPEHAVLLSTLERLGVDLPGKLPSGNE